MDDLNDHEDVVDDESIDTEGQQEGEESSDEEHINNAEENSETGGVNTPGKKEGEELTEKGTKKASDPMSALNQELANTRQKAQVYEELLSNPEKLKEYLEEYEKETKSQSSNTQIADPLAGLDPKSISTVEDLQSFAEKLLTAVKSSQGELANVKNGITEAQQEEAVRSTITNEINQVKTEFPEFRQFNTDGTPNPEFNPELDDLLGTVYESLDFDKQNGKFKGSVSLHWLAGVFHKAAKTGESNGLRKASTIIKDRRGGRIVNGSKGSSTASEQGMTPSQKIAARIQRARAGRK